MNKVKRTFLLLSVCLVMNMLAGCQYMEKERAEVMSEMTGEIPSLPEFVQKTEKTEKPIDLPERYCIEEKQPKIRNQEDTKLIVCSCLTLNRPIVMIMTDLGLKFF